jgi:hypothetical protein
MIMIIIIILSINRKIPLGFKSEYYNHANAMLVIALKPDSYD